jgi:hypothetical protein
MQSVCIVRTTQKYNSSHRRHQVGGNLQCVGFARDDSCCTNAMWGTPAGRARLVPWEMWKIKSNHADAMFCSSNRAVHSKFAQSEWKLGHVETTSGQSWSRQEDPLQVLDGQALFTGLFHMYAATYKDMRDILQPSSKESGEKDSSQAERNKRWKGDRNFEDECCTKKRRGHLRLTKTRGRWPQITCLRHLRIYPWQMRRRAAKETPLKHTELLGFGLCPSSGF